MFLYNFSKFFLRRQYNTVILSKPYRTVFHSILSYQTQTAPSYFYNKTRVRGVESSNRTIIKNSELNLKTRVFLKKYHKITQNKQYSMVFFKKQPSF